jgi:predicted alternative tryptophan synthase beta-subunit
MVRTSFDQKPYRKTVMNLYGAHVVASPSKERRSGVFIRRSALLREVSNGDFRSD